MAELNVVLVNGNSIFTTNAPAFLYEVIIASQSNGYFTIPAQHTGYVEFTTIENGNLQTRYATLKAQDTDLIIDSTGYSLGHFYSDYPAIADSAYIYNSAFTSLD